MTESTYSTTCLVENIDFLSSNIVEIFMHDYLDIIILIKYVKINFKIIIYFERY